MASNSFKSIYHNPALRRRHSIDCPASTRSSCSYYTRFLKPTTTSAPSLSHAVSFSLSSPIASSASSTTTTPSTSQNISFELLQQHLSARNFRQADEETRRLLILLAGEAAQKRGYVFFSEVQFISETDLKAIDQLWRQYSDNKFGYSVQKKLWNKVSKDFTKFFIKVGWMKKLESSEVEQYNYRAFPTEFMWELDENTPEGHLPLTNALRGTQLLCSILSHPAFQGDGSDDEEEEYQVSENKISGSKPLSKGVFKRDYSF